jgi:hypothetical protein
VSAVLAILASKVFWYLLCGVLAAGVTGLVVRSIGASAVAKDDLAETAEAEEEKQDADEELETTHRSLLDVWRRARLRRQRPVR